MTPFADELRQKLALKTVRPRAGVVPQDGEQEAAAAYERLAKADAAAQALVAEIFRPLVDDFRGVMESLGALDDGLIAAEAGPALALAKKNISAGKNPRATSGGRQTKGKSRPGRLLAADYRAFLADRAARGLPPPSPADPAGEIAQFNRFMADERQRAEAAEPNTKIPAWRRLAYRAAGVENGKRYEVRVVVSPCTAAPTATGTMEPSTLELRCECLHGSLSDFRRDSAPALIELPRKRVAAAGADRDAARQWCARVLSRSAEALMAANLGPGGNIDPGRASDCPAGPAAVHAPLMTFPALDAGACPVMA
jgi:hypothetical protein